MVSQSPMEPPSVTVTVLILAVLATIATTNHTAVHSRRKRYLTFPEGSTYSFAFCMELKTVTQDYDLYTEGVAVAANYDLPSRPDLLFTPRPRPPQSVLLRRHRRQIFNNLEQIINLAGLDGRSCVLLALCESSQKLSPRMGMLEELIRIIFRIPTEDMSQDEPLEHWQYHNAYKSGYRDRNLDCQQLYPRCPLSLLTAALQLKPVGLFT